MYDFQAVPLFEGNLEPAVAGHDLAIELDCDPVGLHTELIQKYRKSQAIREFTLLTIQLHLHGNIVARSERKNWHSGRLACLVQVKLARDGSVGVSRLHQHSGLKKIGFSDRNSKFYSTAVIGQALAIERLTLASCDA
jgi:hypothetical protein